MSACMPSVGVNLYWKPTPTSPYGEVRRKVPTAGSANLSRDTPTPASRNGRKPAGVNRYSASTPASVWCTLSPWSLDAA